MYLPVDTYNVKKDYAFSVSKANNISKIRLEKFASEPSGPLGCCLSPVSVARRD